MNHGTNGRTSHLAALLAAAFAFGTFGAAAPALLGSAQPAIAQEAPQGGAPGGGSQRGHMGKILVTLGLNDQQKDKIRGIMAAVRKQNFGLTDLQAKRENFKKAFARIDTILTPAQRAQFKAKMDEWRKSHPMPQGAGH